jgi:GDP-D-mannose 3',5'-epimerase
MTQVLVTGAGGFIGGHLTAELRARGHDVRAADIKPLDQWFLHSEGADEVVTDLTSADACQRVMQDVSDVYNLAADMGGMGFIENNKALCMLTVLINTNMLQAAREAEVARYFFSSSACVYAADRQVDANVTALREEDAYPAEPEDGYGWEKLFSERMCRHFREDFGLQTRVARFHNVYGPLGTYEGGREKAPAALCRKVAIAKRSGVHEIEVWGDGEQSRSFMYIDDCLKGISLIAEGTSSQPVNLGSSELVTINLMIDIIEQIAGIRVTRKYNRSAPQGVRGRNSDNTLFRSLYGWEPDTTLMDGLEKTYSWIYDQMK